MLYAYHTGYNGIYSEENDIYIYIYIVLEEIGGYIRVYIWDVTGYINHIQRCLLVTNIPKGAVRIQSSLYLSELSHSKHH